MDRETWLATVHRIADFNIAEQALTHTYTDIFNTLILFLKLVSMNLSSKRSETFCLLVN